MKILAFIGLFCASAFIFSCGNNDNTTQMPNGGYKQRSDSGAASGDSIKSVKDKNAVGVDTIKNGQAIMSGATSDSSK